MERETADGRIESAVGQRLAHRKITRGVRRRAVLDPWRVILNRGIDVRNKAGNFRAGLRFRIGGE